MAINNTCQHCGKAFPEPHIARKRFCDQLCKMAYYRAQRRAEAIYSRACPVCGKEFQTRQSRKIRCSRECTKRAARVVRHERPCPVCGEVFFPTNGNQRVCSPQCVETLRSQRIAARRAKGEPRRRRPPRDPDPPTPEQIAERTAEIRAGWSEAEFAKRAGKALLPWRAPVLEIKATTTELTQFVDRSDDL